jgi:hypothetical protein
MTLNALTSEQTLSTGANGVRLRSDTPAAKRLRRRRSSGTRGLSRVLPQLRRPAGTLKQAARDADHAVMGITSLVIGGFIGCWIVGSFWLVATFVTELTDKARQPIGRR